MDIDCDGRMTEACNTTTDPYFQPQTAFQTSAGKPLDSARLPFVVVPAPGRIWDYRKSGLTGGSVVAVIHRTRCGTPSSATPGPPGSSARGRTRLAEELSIDPDPTTGGAASGVTYIVFKDSVSHRSRAAPRRSAGARHWRGRSSDAEWLGWAGVRGR